MFGYEDKRTPQERLRDMESNDKRQAEKLLALGFLKSVIRPMLKDAGMEVGLPGLDVLGAELLIENAGITYKLTLSVDHDD